MFRQSIIVFLFSLVFLSSCGIPGAEKRSTRNLHNSIQRVDDVIATQETNYNNFLNGSEYKRSLLSLAKKENWSGTFTEARTLLDSARYFEQIALTLVELNEKESLPYLKQCLVQTRQYLHLAETIGRPVLKELSYMNDFAGRAKNLGDSSLLVLQEEIQKVANISQKFKSVRQYSEKVAQLQPIKSRLDSLNLSVNQSSDSLRLLINNWEQPGTMDLRAFHDHYQKQTVNHRKFLVDYNELHIFIEELLTSSTRILTDMRLEYYVQIGRTTWDNSSDYNTDKDFIYPLVQVNEGVYEYFENWGDKTLGSLTRTACDKGYWSDLGIPKRKDLPNRHDKAEFWINDLPIKYFHQYLLEENGDTIHTGWREISEAQFFNDIDNLGMATYTKPAGYFETEAHRGASPPGLIQVGNAKYGEWKEEGNSRTWHFFPAYAFFTSNLSPNHHYTRLEHESWKNTYLAQNKSYYGTNLDKPTYGTWRNDRDSTRRNRIRHYILYNGWNERQTGGGSGGAGARMRGIGSNYRGRGPEGSGK